MSDSTPTSPAPTGTPQFPPIVQATLAEYRYFVVHKRSLDGTALIEYPVVAHICQPTGDGMVVFYDVTVTGGEPVLRLRRAFYQVEDVEEVNLPSQTLLAH